MKGSQRESMDRKSFLEFNSQDMSNFENMKTKPTENTYLQTDQEEENNKTILQNKRYQERQQKIKEIESVFLKSCSVKSFGKVSSVYTDLKPTALSTTNPQFAYNNMQQQQQQQNLHQNINNNHANPRQSIQRKSIRMNNRGSMMFGAQLPNIQQQQQIQSPTSLTQQRKSRQSVLQQHQQQLQGGGFYVTEIGSQQQSSNNLNSQSNSKQQSRKQTQFMEKKLSQRLLNNVKIMEEGTNKNNNNIPSSMNASSVYNPDASYLKKKTYNSTHDHLKKEEEEEEKFIYKNRIRDFTFKPIDRANLFEGLPFVQFENYVRKDKYMQKNIIRDLLKILADKCHTFKQVLFDRKKLLNTFKSLQFYSKIRFNQTLEQLVGVIETIVVLILHDFKAEELDQFGQDPSPIIIEFSEYLVEALKKNEVSPSPVQEYRDCEKAGLYYEGNSQNQQRSVMMQNQQQQQEQQQQNNSGNNFNSSSRSNEIANYNLNKKNNNNNQGKNNLNNTEQKQKKSGKNQTQATQNNSKKPLEQQNQQQNDQQQQQGYEEDESYMVNPLARKLEQIYVRPEICSIEEEEKVLRDNVNLFEKMTDLIRDTIDAFRILQRQREYKGRSDSQCYFLLKCITQARYQMGEIQESIRIYEINNEDAKRWALQNSDQDKLKANQAQPRDEEQVAKDEEKKRRQRLQHLLLNKFNFAKSRFQTREAKINLNDEKFEQEKQLLQEMNSENSQVKTTIADNRKKVALERLKNPHRDPEIAFAIKVARTVPNLVLPKNLFSH